jgi:hypothetical protein
MPSGHLAVKRPDRVLTAPRRRTGPRRPFPGPARTGCRSGRHRPWRPSRVRHGRDDRGPAPFPGQAGPDVPPGACYSACGGSSAWRALCGSTRGRPQRSSSRQARCLLSANAIRPGSSVWGMPTARLGRRRPEAGGLPRECSCRKTHEACDGNHGTGRALLTDRVGWLRLRLQASTPHDLASSTYGCRRAGAVADPIHLSNSVLTPKLQMPVGGRTGMLPGGFSVLEISHSCHLHD